MGVLESGRGRGAFTSRTFTGKKKTWFGSIFLSLSSHVCFAFYVSEPSLPGRPAAAAAAVAVGGLNQIGTTAAAAGRCPNNSAAEIAAQRASTFRETVGKLDHVDGKSQEEGTQLAS